MSLSGLITVFGHLLLAKKSIRSDSLERFFNSFVKPVPITKTLGIFLLHEQKSAQYNLQKKNGIV